MLFWSDTQNMVAELQDSASNRTEFFLFNEKNDSKILFCQANEISFTCPPLNMANSEY